MKNNIYKNKVLSVEIIFISVVLFLINPLASIILVFNALFSKGVKLKSNLINLLIIFLALSLSFINMTKVPENDLQFHAYQYLFVENRSLFEYLVIIKKEPIGYIFNFLIYHISNGSIKIWIFVFTFSSYLLFFSALKLFFQKITAPYHLLVFGLILAAFFPQLFSLSAHLIRQFIASSIFIYFAVDKIFYGNNKWWLAILGVLTHGSSLILYLFIYFKFIGNFKRYMFLNIYKEIIIYLFKYIDRCH